MATIANEVTVHAIAIMTLTTLAVIFRGPIRTTFKTVVTMARGLCRNVSGEWCATLLADGETFEHTIRLRQFADFIWGTIHCETTGRTFRVTGRMVHHALIARYELTNGNEIAIDSGTFSLRLNDDGDQLRGHLTCSAGRASHSSQCEYIWRRTADATTDWLQAPATTNTRLAPTTITTEPELVEVTQ